jgi:hypothetical protein
MMTMGELADRDEEATADEEGRLFEKYNADNVSANQLAEDSSAGLEEAF